MRPTEMHVRIDVHEAHDGLGVCRIVGELDSSSAPRFREVVSELCAHPTVAIDLAGVPFIDSAGLGALVGGVRRIREAGGRVALFGPRRNVGRLIRIAGFDRVAPLLDTFEDAVEELVDPLERLEGAPT